MKDAMFTIEEFQKFDETFQNMKAYLELNVLKLDPQILNSLSEAIIELIKTNTCIPGIC